MSAFRPCCDEALTLDEGLILLECPCSKFSTRRYKSCRLVFVTWYPIPCMYMSVRLREAREPVLPSDASDPRDPRLDTDPDETDSVLKERLKIKE